MTARRVSVGIVNHNGESYLRQTLRAVARLGPAVDDVLLIDSGSTDRGVALAREQFPQVRVIELGANLGPGAARNRAIREAAHDRVLLIDNDVEPQPGSVEALAAALDGHPNAILAMAAVLYAAGARHGAVCRRRAALPGDARRCSRRIRPWRSWRTACAWWGRPSPAA